MRNVLELKFPAAQLLDIYEQTLATLVIDDETGLITYASRPLEVMFGYERIGSLVGNDVEVLVPESVREKHQLHRSGFRQAPHIRAMGEGLPLQGQRLDGTTFPLRVILTPTVLNTVTGQRDSTVAIVYPVVVRPIGTILEP